MKAVRLVPVTLLAFAVPSQAVDFGSSEHWKNSLDITLTYGATWRVRGQDDALIADPNLDDANRNFDSGLVSNGLRGIAEFETRYTSDSQSEFGLLLRGAAWYDAKVWSATNDNDSPLTCNSCEPYGTLEDHREFVPDVQDRSGRDAELLDAVLYANFQPTGKHPLTVRLGRQVINWGESAFIQNGLSSFINPADTSKANLPGTEVKEILRPLGAAFASVALTGTLTLQGYYQFEWEETISPPYGTYFSAVPDPLSGVGSQTYLAPVALVKSRLPFPQDASHYTLPFAAVDRVDDEEAGNSGQWGLGLKWFVPALNDAQFGFYAGNYSRKRPTIVFRSSGGDLDNNWIGQCLGGTGGPPPTPQSQTCLPLSGVLTGFDTASYQLVYEEDIKYYGVSWNSVIPLIDTAWSGEVIYHQDVPMQTTALLDGILGTVLPALPPPVGAGVPQETHIFSRQNMVVTQMTFNKSFGNMGFWDDLSLIGELGWIHVLSLEDGEVWAGNAKASKDSFGTKIAMAMTWYDALGGFLSGTNLIWTVNFDDDFSGTAPVVGTGFVSGQKAISTGLEAAWLGRWSAKLSYTDFYGDGYNTLGQRLGDSVLGDRDNVSLSVKFHF